MSTAEEPPASFPEERTVFMLADDTTPSVGQSVTLTVAVAEAGGGPVADALCMVEVMSQPGTDASVEPSLLTTGTDGSATTTLYVGSTPGEITVAADCGGIPTSLSLTVQGESPPASLPDSGDGGVFGMPSSGGTALLSGSLAVSGALLAAAGWYTGRRRRPQFVPQMKPLR